MISKKISTSISTIPVEHSLFSRVHALRSFPLGCYVKREDELGFGISGTKARKYLSLLPSLLEQQPDEAILVGSAYSNHVLSFSQLLVENGVVPVLFLLGDEKCAWEGNLLYSGLIAGIGNIHWIPRSQWSTVDQRAEGFAEKRRLEGKKTVVVSKGGNCAASIPGAMTLAQDILRNELELGLQFDHILIDSGTGLTACALILYFALLGRPTLLHILLVAGDREEFERTLAARKQDLEQLLGSFLPTPNNFRLYSPTTAAAFGSVNTAVFKTVARIAGREGFLTDPVFTAKLFYEGEKIISGQRLQGNILFIHSGGGLGLTGFQRQMGKTLLEKNQES